ncbi:MAG: GNAT family N-acetyltransferase [Actinobacteria bacterium]|nr:GNAT family N-acetyltransferase [Actinomycetota bacterium]
MEKDLKDFKIRFAIERDAGLILDFIKQLAGYEKRADEVIATEKDIIAAIFKQKTAEAIIGEYCDIPISFAIFFYNFSTFIGKPGIYIEDLYVKPEMRGKGIGTLMLSFLAKLTISRRCCRMEWSVLKWNKPGINFYRKIEAVPKDEWVIYKISGNALKKLAAIKNHQYF